MFPMKGTIKGNWRFSYLLYLIYSHNGFINLLLLKITIFSMHHIEKNLILNWAILPVAMIGRSDFFISKRSKFL